MSNSTQDHDSEDTPPVPLHAVEEGGDALAEANTRAKANEARLRKVSSAYKQLQGEMEALRKRHARQRDADQRLMKAQLVKGLFEPLQNLRRSVEAMAKAGVDAEMLVGAEMVGRNFMEAFEEMGMEKVPGVGAVFSPEMHEALSVVPVVLASADGRVIEVFAEGYRVGETLIQPAKVIIGKYTAPPQAPDDGEE
jgi:molecular chaperone GrpE